MSQEKIKSNQRGVWIKNELIIWENKLKEKKVVCEVIN